MHIFGRFRWPIIIIITVILTIAFHKYLSNFVYRNDLRQSAKWFRICITCVGSFLFAFIVTTELIIRAIIAFLLAAIIGTILGFITYFGIEAFSKGQTKADDLRMWGIIAGGLSGFVAWTIFYTHLDSSSWIGTRCPSCQIRGKLSHSQIGKDYLSDTHVGSGSQTTRYNKFLITTLHECSSCGHSWQSTSEHQERAR